MRQRQVKLFRSPSLLTITSCLFSYSILSKFWTVLGSHFTVRCALFSISLVLLTSCSCRGTARRNSDRTASVFPKSARFRTTRTLPSTTHLISTLSLQISLQEGCRLLVVLVIHCRVLHQLQRAVRLAHFESLLTPTRLHTRKGLKKVVLYKTVPLKRAARTRLFHLSSSCDRTDHLFPQFPSFPVWWIAKTTGQMQTESPRPSLRSTTLTFARE